MNDTLLTLENVTVRFDGRPVLDGVNLEVRRGECLVLIGPSGQGKTTVLKTLSGLIEPEAGEMKVENKNWKTLSSAMRLKYLRETGMLFQKNALFDSLTCFENVAFPLRETTSLSESEIREKVEHFLESVGLSHARDLTPDEISGGMQKRLGIARALALAPQVIFYDDPTAGLDPITSRKIIDLILRMKKANNSTVVAVTNDMKRAEQMADRVAYVGDGQVLVTGSFAETRDHANPKVSGFIRGRLAAEIDQRP